MGHWGAKFNERSFDEIPLDRRRQDISDQGPAILGFAVATGTAPSSHWACSFAFLA
jgi:hypothetical protein